MNENEILERLQNLTRTVLGRNDIVLNKKTKFEQLGISSFGMIQLICAIEEEFEIEVPNAALRSINSVPAAVRLIQKNMKCQK